MNVYCIQFGNYLYVFVKKYYTISVGMAFKVNMKHFLKQEVSLYGLTFSWDKVQIAL